jgi:hypothetical protein
MSSKFYIVWSPCSELAPKVRYTSAKQARAVARNMADKYPGQQFIVLEAQSGYTSEGPTTLRTGQRYKTRSGTEVLICHGPLTEGTHVGMYVNSDGSFSGWDRFRTNGTLVSGGLGSDYEHKGSIPLGLTEEVFE